ncbi:MAG: hypothetical protein ACYC9O_13165, partial [Candidatus Latescibacterota bacterium]
EGETDIVRLERDRRLNFQRMEHMDMNIDETGSNVAAPNIDGLPRAVDRNVISHEGDFSILYGNVGNLISVVCGIDDTTALEEHIIYGSRLG